MKRGYLILTAGLLLFGVAGCLPEGQDTNEGDQKSPEMDAHENDQGAEPGTDPNADQTAPAGKEDQEFIGLTKDEGEALAKKQGQKWRVISVDGKHFPVTMDFMPDRLNFTLKDGKIIAVSRG
jgi:hypothetical protein